MDIDIIDDQTPSDVKPREPEKGLPPKEGPDTGSKPDVITPDRPDKGAEPLDPKPDMDPDAVEPVEDPAR